MKSQVTSLRDVLLLEPKVFGDDRGFFLESWNERMFATLGIGAHFVQDNHSVSKKWTLRGMHYQLNRPQGKLVWVVEGEVFDVAVDLRKSSGSFGRWEGFRLSAENRLRLWIPPGFAHGFLVTSPTVQFLYKCTDYYDPSDEQTLSWDDPQIAIRWPLGSLSPILSAKDSQGHLFATAPTFP